MAWVVECELCITSRCQKKLTTIFKSAAMGQLYYRRFKLVNQKTKSDFTEQNTLCKCLFIYGGGALFQMLSFTITALQRTWLMAATAVEPVSSENPTLRVPCAPNVLRVGSVRRNSASPLHPQPHRWQHPNPFQQAERTNCQVSPPGPCTIHREPPVLLRGSEDILSRCSQKKW